MYRDEDGTLYFDAPEVIHLDGIDLLVVGTEILNVEAVGYAADNFVDPWSGVQAEFEYLYVQ